MTSKSHLHPFALVYYLYKDAYQWFALIVVTFGAFFKSKVLQSHPILILAIILGILVVWVFLKYLMFTYELTDSMITINSGVFIKKHIHIPYSKIQTVQTNQWFFLVPFKLQQLKIETASQTDSRPEAILPVVSVHVNEQIDQRRKKSSSQSTLPIEPNTLAETSNKYHINFRDLQIFALTSMGIIPVFLVIFTLTNQLENIIPDKYLSSLYSHISQQPLAIIIMVIIGGLLLSILITYFNIIQKYYHFTVFLQKNDLQTTQGLLASRNTTIPLKRIQAVLLKQNIIRALFKLTSIKAITASSAGDDELGQSLIVLPVIKNTKIFAQLNKLIKWTPAAQPRLTGIPRKSDWYYIRNHSIIYLVVIFWVLMAFKLQGLFSLLILIIPILSGWFSGRNTKFSIQNNNLILQRGRMFERSLFIIPRKNVQSFAVRQSIWMTRTHLAHFVVNVRSGNLNLEVKLAYLPESAANQLFDWLKKY